MMGGPPLGRWCVDNLSVPEGSAEAEDHPSSSTALGTTSTSVPGLAAAGIVAQRPGKVRLRPREELPGEWDPRADARLTVWEVTQQLIRRLESGGEDAAAPLLSEAGSGLGETAKELAYRLYLICERKGWAKEAISYNALVTAWPELTRLAASVDRAASTQGELL